MVTDYDKNHLLNVQGFKSAVLNALPTAYGWTGVQLFLLISGFVIHYGFLSGNEKLKVFTFFNKRFWRIYPAYLLALLVYCFLGKGMNYYLFSKVGLMDLLTHLFLVHNLSNAYFHSVNSSFWTLALEMQLYLLYPLFLIVRKKLGIKKALFLTFMIAPVSYAIGSFIVTKEARLPRVNFVLNFWFMWCSGAFLAEKYLNGERIFPKRAGAIIVLGFMATILIKFHVFGSLLCSLVATFSWLVFFEWFLYNPRINTNSIVFKTFTAIGVSSYSIYLIHQPYLSYILNWFNVLSVHPYLAFIKTIPAFTIVFSISYLMYRFIEVPFIKLGNFLRWRKNIRVPVTAVI